MWCAVVLLVAEGVPPPVLVGWECLLCFLLLGLVVAGVQLELELVVGSALLVDLGLSLGLLKWKVVVPLGS